MDKLFLIPIPLMHTGVKNLIPPWVGATNNELDLSEKSWTVMKGQGHGHPPTAIQMIRLLSSLSAVHTTYRETIHHTHTQAQTRFNV